jgi:hypothetical protein
MNPLTQSKNTTILSPLIALTLGCFALLPQAWAVCQEGCGLNANTFLGDYALINDVGFGLNTAIGHQALYNNTTGEQNTAMGVSALFSNTTGFGNVAIGNFSLSLNNGSRNVAIHGMEWNSTGNNNTAVGFIALEFNTTGSNNTAIGYEAGFGDPVNGTGSNNTVTGYQAFHSYTTGSFNTANGASALYANTTGNYNTANGVNALFSNTNGNLNTATGLSALYANTGGSFNTADGYQALAANTTGTNNTACGISALLNNSTGSSNVALGSNAGANLTDGSNNIDIGNAGIAGESNTIRIGTQGTQMKTFVAGISGIAIGGGVAVRVGANGQLGTVVSSARFKDTVQPMDKASEAILALKPVTFRYKHDLDPEGIAQFGLVAEDVEKVNPDLVARDEQGKPYTVRYEAVNAMLLNEFLKEHREVQELKKQVAALTTGLQKVSAQLELGKAAPQTVLNDQ